MQGCSTKLTKFALNANYHYWAYYLPIAGTFDSVRWRRIVCLSSAKTTQSTQKAAFLSWLSCFGKCITSTSVVVTMCVVYTVWQAQSLNMWRINLHSSECTDNELEEKQNP